MTLRFIYPATALIAVLVSGVVHGLLPDRWQPAPEPAARAARVRLGRKARAGRCVGVCGGGRLGAGGGGRRRNFAPRSVLFKLYLLREERSSNRSSAQVDNTEFLANEPCLDLMRQLLPE